LLELTPEILAHLTAGGTLLVPTPQRAAALRLAYSAAQLGAGRRVWDSPDVLSWNAWLERGLDEARARGVPVPRRLSRAEEWWLWRQAVRAACSDLAVLWPDALIDSVRRAVLLLEDYGLELHDAASAETAVLLRAGEHFERRCHELHALWSRSWRACADYLQPASVTLMAGFAQLGSARRAWLDRINVLSEPTEPEAAPGALQVLDFDNPELEAQAAAQWCAGRLAQDPGARLLLIVMRLPEQRHRWLRALGQSLDQHRILDPGSAQGHSVLAIEGGVPLIDYPLIATALRLLSLAAGEADFDALSAVLRTPFLDPAARAARLRLDLWLREHNIEATQLPLLQALIEPVNQAPDEAAAVVLRALIQALSLHAPPIVAPAAPAPPALWAQRFALVLARCGWPGPDLSSAEQQVRARFEELLGEFAAMAIAPQLLQASQALQWLHQLAARTAFEPASDDVPVTVTSYLDDPIVRYDGIWIAGLTAEVWPQAPRPDPLIPWALQQAAGMAMASPGGPLRLAEQALRRWRHATPELAMSWARSDGDLPCDPSPLLREAADEAVPASAEAAAAHVPLESWLAASAPALEPWRDDSGPAWPAAQALLGGTRLLELQALCPFRSFAQLRLQAQPVPEPAPGIDPRLRGQILHHALELFWRATADSRTLCERAEQAELRLLRECVESALAQAEQRAPGSLEPSGLRREAERAVRVLQQLLAWERTREPFQTLALEWRRAYAVAGATLRLRLDRVDQLSDGRLIVIDYKSGSPESFEPHAERPRLPQLPAYAMAAGEQTAAVLALYLGREGPRLRGVADRAGRLIGLRALPEGEAAWPALLQRWREQLRELVQEFLSGHAAVRPQPGACEICHLQAFCRIQPSGASRP
jgi:probable DNA repair protein